MNMLRLRALLTLPPCLLSPSRQPVADATSIKMDYLPIGHARVDPILSSTCPSDHVHAFYGPQSGVDPRRIDEGDPLELHAKLLVSSVDENSGNVEENKSLYWHPSVYKHDRSAGRYSRAEMAQTSAYYVWDTGMTTAFPDGFRMIGGFDVEKSRAFAECVGESPCNDGDCYTENEFFPSSRCEELEVSMRMPRLFLSFNSCWDGTSIQSPPDHTSHRATARHRTPPEYRESNFSSGSFPIGGWHTFSDGSSVFHADYVSGWENEFLQNVLDGCDNEGDGAMPNFFCEDMLSYRDAPKCTDERTCDFADPALLEKLKGIQPDTPLDVRATIIEEETRFVQELPRGLCSGTLVGNGPATGSPSSSPTSEPSAKPTSQPTLKPTEANTAAPTKNPNTPLPTAKPTTEPTAELTTPPLGGPCAGPVVELYDFESGDYSDQVEGVRNRNGDEYPARRPWSQRSYGPSVCGPGSSWSLMAGQGNNGKRGGVDDETWFTVYVPDGAGSFDFMYNRNQLDENFDRFEVFVNGEIVHSFQGGNAPFEDECMLATCVVVEPGDEVDFLCRSR
ncbi:hypothetical protein ACHAWF_006704, partial [Thalassiosira exigua]